MRETKKEREREMRTIPQKVMQTKVGYKMCMEDDTMVFNFYFLV